MASDRTRLYRALLHFYPASFRSEYGGEMCSVFSQRRREASNIFALAALWIESVLDIFAGGARVHFDILRQDLKFARRSLLRSPGFTLTAVTVVALGVGANTAVFTMVDHVLLRPLPFPDSERLVKIYEQEPQGYYGELSPANYRDWRQSSRSFEAMGGYRGLSVKLVGASEPQQIEGASMTASVFGLLGWKPQLGRVFTEQDDRVESAGTVVLSDGLWHRMFGGDPAALGRTVDLDDRPYVIIGVMPPNFYFPNRESELWTPMRFAPADFADRSNTFVNVIGKLKRGTPLAQAQAEMRVVTAQLQAQYPKELEHIGARINLLRDEVSSQTRLLLMALLGAAICVLLIACTNLANLLLARALNRRKELAVRAAMGAGRERLVRQVLTESLILAVGGGLAGVALATLGLPLLAQLVPTNLPVAQVPPIDVRVLLFAAGLTAITGIGFGAVPALRLSSEGLREGSRAGVGGRKERIRGALVIAEVAGCVMLLISTGLLLRALWRVQRTDPGFRSEGVLTLRTALPMPKYQNPAAREQFYQRMLPAIRQLPGVTGASYISFLPFVNKGGVWPVAIPEHPQPPANLEKASLRFVTPGFFAAMGIPLRLGRDVAESDTAELPFVAVVSESFARKYWPNENPLGRHFEFGNADRTVVGVVGDIRFRGLERSSEPQVYLSYRQPAGVSAWYAPKDLAIRSSSDPRALLPAVRRILRDADPEQPVSAVHPLDDIVDAETAPRSVQARILGAFAAIAFLLAGIGIHGLLSFGVSNRTQEIGVRLAIGAHPSDIVRMILGEGLLLSAIGTLFGAAAAYAAGLQIQSLLAGVQPGDVAAFAAGIGLVALVTALGSAGPALRAARVDPITAIRAE